MSAVRHWQGTASNIRLGDLSSKNPNFGTDLGRTGKQVVDKDENRQGHTVYHREDMFSQSVGNNGKVMVWSG